MSSGVADPALLDALARTPLEERFQDGPDFCIETVFDGLRGSRLWKAILKKYCVNKHATLKVVRVEENGDVTLLCTRSVNNNRQQAQNVRQYAQGILEKGVYSQMRGQPVAGNRMKHDFAKEP